MVGIEHIAICAKDSKALCEWYVDMFGLKVVFQNDDGVFFVKLGDGSMLEIMRATGGSQPEHIEALGIRHLALSLETSEEFDSYVEKIKNANMKVLEEVVEFESGLKTFFFADPEGNVMHFIYRPEACAL